MAAQIKRLPGGFRLGVKPTECGSKVRSNQKIKQIFCEDKSTYNDVTKITDVIDYNMCFYACLSEFILKNTRTFQDFFPKIHIIYSEFKKLDRQFQKAILMLRMKRLFTTNLPFIHIDMIENDPATRGGMVDERVIYNAARCLRVNIIILNSGQQIYKATPTIERGKVDICLLLNRSHYQLCEVPDDIQNMNEILNCTNLQEIEEKVAQIKREKEANRTCKKRRNKNKFNWTKKEM